MIIFEVFMGTTLTLNWTGQINDKRSAEGAQREKLNPHKPMDTKKHAVNKGPNTRRKAGH